MPRQDTEGEKNLVYVQHRRIPEEWCLVVRNGISLGGVNCYSSTYKSMGKSAIILGTGKSGIATLTVLSSLVSIISLIANLWVSIDF